MQALVDIADCFKAGLLVLLTIVDFNQGVFPFKRLGFLKPYAMFLHVGGDFPGVVCVVH